MVLSSCRVLNLFIIFYLFPQESGADGYSLESLRPEVQSLGRRLLSLSTPTPVHLLAQSTMALHTANNIKYIMSLDADRLIEGTDVVSPRYVTTF